MTTIEQTVDIPADRRITIEVPREVPEGKARVELKVIPFVKKEEDKPLPKGKLFRSKKELDEFLANAHTPISDSLTGILAHLGDITIEQIRDERLAKHLK
jgi:hypothetical protein